MGEDKGEGEKKNCPLTLTLSRHACGRSLRRQRGEGKRIISIDTLAL
jgi:hypothetical protein